MTGLRSAARTALVVLNGLVLAVALLSLPYVRTDAVVPPDYPVSAAGAVAHLQRVWERASREPGPSRLQRSPGVETRDDCSIGLPGPGPETVDDGTRRLTWRSQPGDDGADLLRQVELALLASGHEVFPGYPADGVQVLTGDGAFRWILRLEGERALVTGESPCLLVVLPQRFAAVRNQEDVRSLLVALRDKNSLDSPLQVTHYLRFPGIDKPGQQKAAAAQAVAAGWSVRTGQTVDGGFFDFGGDLVVLARREVRLTADSVAEDRVFFETVCTRAGCRYDGWDTTGRGYELR